MRAVLQHEMLLSGRRRRTVVLRFVYLVLLLAQLVPLFFTTSEAWRELLMRFYTFGFFDSFLTQHFLILLLLTPGLVGGAITEEKSRGNLDYLLTSNLSASDIVLGKLFARIWQLAVVSLVALPLVSLFAGLADDASFPVAVMGCSWAMLFGVAGVSILVSVLCRRTRDALLILYTLLFLAILLVQAFPRAAWAVRLSLLFPMSVFAEPDPLRRWSLLGVNVLQWVSIGGVAVLLACLRLRGAYRRQLQGVAGPRILNRLWGRSLLKVRGNPVLWREQRMEGIAPLAWLRLWPRWTGLVAVALLSSGTLAYFLCRAAPAATNPWALFAAGQWGPLWAVLSPAAGEIFWAHGLAFLAAMSFLTAIRASGAITGERERGTWLPLVMTPLTTAKIVQGKHWGIVWAGLPYVGVHALVTLGAAAWLGAEPFAWAVLWPLVTVAAMILGSAMGLYASARCRTSWGSLLFTLAAFYASWIALLVPVTFILFVFRGMIHLVVFFIGLFQNLTPLVNAVADWNPLLWAVGLGVAVAYYVLTHRLLAAAVTQVGRNDRTMGADIDYYHLSKEHQRRKEAEAWEAPRIDLEEDFAQSAPVTAPAGVEPGRIKVL